MMFTCSISSIISINNSSMSSGMKSNDETSITELNELIGNARAELESLHSARRDRKKRHLESCRSRQARIDESRGKIGTMLKNGGSIRRYLKIMKRVYGKDKSNRPGDDILERQIHLLSLSHHLENQRNDLKLLREQNVDMIDLFHQQLKEAQEARKKMLQEFEEKESEIMKDGTAKNEAYKHKLCVQRLMMSSIRSRVQHLNIGMEEEEEEEEPKKLENNDGEKKNAAGGSSLRSLDVSGSSNSSRSLHGNEDLLGTTPRETMDSLSENFRHRVSQLKGPEDLEQSMQMLLEDECVSPRWQRESESFSMSLVFQRSKSSMNNQDTKDTNNGDSSAEDFNVSSSNSNSSSDFNASDYVNQVAESFKATVSKLMQKNEQPVHTEEEGDDDDDDDDSEDSDEEDDDEEEQDKEENRESGDKENKEVTQEDPSCVANPQMPPSREDSVENLEITTKESMDKDIAPMKSLEAPKVPLAGAVEGLIKSDQVANVGGLGSWEIPNLDAARGA